MNKIFTIDTIEELREYIKFRSADKLRPTLLTAFVELVDYKNIKEWNKLVRVCEALQITGWQDNEPYEANAKKWINGAFYTELQNSFFEQKIESSKQWSKHKNSFVIAEETADKKDYGIPKLATQRNKLPKSPIRWTRSGNYQRSVQSLIDSLEILKNKIVRQTNPKLYGDTFSYVSIKFHFSNRDDENSSVRYEYFHDEKDIPDEFAEAKNPGGMPAYYIRPRFDVGKLSTKDNELKLVITRHFTKAFGYLDLSEQKKILKTDFLEIIDIVSDKLQKKKIEYDTTLLKSDTEKVFSEW